MGPERLLALAETALREACAPLGCRSARSAAVARVPGTAVELRPGFTEKDAEAVRTGLARLEGLPVGLLRSHRFSPRARGGIVGPRDSDRADTNRAPSSRVW